MAVVCMQAARYRTLLSVSMGNVWLHNPSSLLLFTDHIIEQEVREPSVEGVMVEVPRE